MRWAVAAVLLVPLLSFAGAHAPPPSCGDVDAPPPEDAGLAPAWRSGLAWWFSRDGVPTTVVVGDESVVVIDVQTAEPTHAPYTVRGRPLVVSTHDEHGNDVYSAMYHDCRSYRLAAVQLDVVGPTVNARTLIGYDPPVPSPFSMGLQAGDDVTVETEATRYDVVGDQVVGPTTERLRYHVEAAAEPHPTTTPYGTLDTYTLTLSVRHPDEPAANATITRYEYAPEVDFWATMDKGATLASDGTHWELTGHRPTAPPTAVAAVSPRTLAPGGTITLDGTASHDHDGRIVAWAWTIDGTRVLDGPTGTLALTEPGVHAVQLVVTDDLDASGASTVYVEVLAAGSSLRIDGPRGVFAGEVASYTATADVPLRRVTWQFPDGVVKAGAAVEHVFLEPGNANVTVSAFDEGGVLFTSGLAVTVWDPADPGGPDAPDPGVEPEALAGPRILSPRTGTIVKPDTTVLVRTGGQATLALYAGDDKLADVTGGPQVSRDVTIPATDLVTLSLRDATGAVLDSADVFVQTSTTASPSPPLDGGDGGPQPGPNASGTPAAPALAVVGALVAAAAVGRRRP